ncbi:MAG: DoxX family protein [Prolixibacteraceae bacterium]|nr:DoxX family protein [Prolixibacteraceae bacterium]
MLKRLLYTDTSKTTLLIRSMVGIVFLSEGIQRYLFPALRGAGRFENIGLPSPEFLGYFVGAFEIICGILVLIGLFTPLGAIPLITIMIVAISTTKVEILLDKGFWEMMHAARTDFSMLLGSIFLLIKGGGFWSLDLKFFSGGKKG